MVSLCEGSERPGEKNDRCSGLKPDPIATRGSHEHGTDNVPPITPSPSTQKACRRSKYRAERRTTLIARVFEGSKKKVFSPSIGDSFPLTQFKATHVDGFADVSCGVVGIGASIFRSTDNRGIPASDPELAFFVSGPRLNYISSQEMRCHACSVSHHLTT